MDTPRHEGDAGGADILAELKRQNEPPELIQGEAIRFDGITLRQLSRALAAHALLSQNRQAPFDEAHRKNLDASSAFIEMYARAGEDEPEAVDKGDSVD